MAWTDIDDYRVAELVEPADLNVFKLNLDFLAQPPLAYFQRSTTGGDYTTSAVQNMVPIDPINMRLQITTGGGILVAILQGTMKHGGTAVFPAVSFDIDDERLYDNGVKGRWAGFNLSSVGDGYTFIMPIFGVLAGVHTIQPIWANDIASRTSILVDDYAPFFGVWEI